MRRIVVGMTGSTGCIYGVRLLEVLRETEGVESHLILSSAAKRTLVEELPSRTPQEIESLADVSYDNRDIGAALSSGSFKIAGMAIVPCSIKTVSSLANSHADTLIARAGDVTLKEGRRLVVVARETPLHAGHLRQLLVLAELGAVILPPMPAFYQRPKTIQQLVDHTVGRILDRLEVSNDLVPEWTGKAG